MIPHQKPMLWVDQVVSDDEVEIILDSRAHYMKAEGTDTAVLRKSSLLEFMAQAFGLLSANHREDGAPTALYLADIRDAKFVDAAILMELKEGDRLRVQILDVRAFGTLTLFSAQILAPDGLVLAKASLKVQSSSHKETPRNS